MSHETVDIRVEVADAVLRPTQLLVVKYAQASYGLDRQVADRVGISQVLLPAPGAHLYLHANSEIAAESVLFLGLPDQSHFGYHHIREFGYRAVSVAAEVAAYTREICVTLHGPGFGLDETESFAAEVAGLVDAMTAAWYCPTCRPLHSLNWTGGAQSG